MSRSSLALICAQKDKLWLVSLSIALTTRCPKAIEQPVDMMEWSEILVMAGGGRCLVADEPREEETWSGSPVALTTPYGHRANCQR